MQIMKKFISAEVLPDDLIEKYMQIAIDESKADTPAAIKSSDVPVGCIIIDKNGQIIAKAHNTREQTHSVTGHAEINAINEVSLKTGDYHLDGSIVFITLEPCPMCAGALAAARPKAVYYGAPNTVNGAAGTVYNLLEPHIKVFGGIKASEISSRLSSFFTEIRRKHG